MFLLTYRTCKLLQNLIDNPWRCSANNDHYDMCEKLQEMIDAIFLREGLEDNIYFRAAAHITFDEDNRVIYASHISIASKDPEVVLGDIKRMKITGKEAVFEMTDEYNDRAAFKSISMVVIDDEVV